MSAAIDELSKNLERPVPFGVSSERQTVDRLLEQKWATRVPGPKSIIRSWRPRATKP